MFVCAASLVQQFVKSAQFAVPYNGSVRIATKVNLFLQLRIVRIVQIAAIGEQFVKFAQFVVPYNGSGHVDSFDNGLNGLHGFGLPHYNNPSKPLSISDYSN